MCTRANNSSKTMMSISTTTCTLLVLLALLLTTTTTINAFTSPSIIENRPAAITAVTSSSIRHRYQEIRMVPSSALSLTSVSATTSSKPSSSTSSSSTSSSSVLPKTQYPNPQLADPWYSTKIQTDMGYTTKVKSLYLRHCVLERKETAELALQWYLQLTSSSDGGASIGTESGIDLTTSRDPFGDVTKQLSACTMTREEGGKIGWVDIDVDVIDVDNSNNKKKKELTAASLIPDDILRSLVELQPKAGDVHIVGPSSITNQVHVIRVEELYIPNIILPESIPAISNKKTTIKLGSFNGVNALVPRNKLKGHGVMPTVPKFELQKNRKGETVAVVVDNGDDSNDSQSQESKQRTYAIQTNGCQMNVADSERLEGILQNELGLVPISEGSLTDSTIQQEINQADVIIFNTCSIRDHAEQKLYDALGPFRARKRKKNSGGDNTDFALIVTGCVAQQEGMNLLQKIPEIDVVLGPQYVPYLGEVLSKIQWGYQFCLTEPTIIIDNYKSFYQKDIDPPAVADSNTIAAAATTTTTAQPGSRRTDTEIETDTATATSSSSSSSSSAAAASLVTSTALASSSSSSSAEVKQQSQQIQQRQLLPENDDFSSKPIRGHTIRAWVNVIYGCNEHCTYCVVPATRGMEQSRSMESILEECLDLIENRGYKEITLLGQNIDAYGRDMVPKRTFADLLHYLNSNVSNLLVSAPTLPSSSSTLTSTTALLSTKPNKCRLRYVTSHPRYFSDRVIDAVSTLESVCECFHMPFQAGDNDVLRRMRRGYTFESYMKIINKIRHQSPDAAITADVIVGFPGETEAMFQRTLDLMTEVKFDNLNSFAYSARPNTEAGTWTNDDIDVVGVTTSSTTATTATTDSINLNNKDKGEGDNDNTADDNYFVVPEEVKKERLSRVQELAVQHGLERSQRYLGRTIEVLVEDINPRRAHDQVMGRTRQGRQVFFDGNIEELKGEFVDVEIIEARTWSLMGQPITTTK